MRRAAIIRDRQVNLWQQVARIHPVRTGFRQHHLAAHQGIVAVVIAARREGDGQIVVFLIGCDVGRSHRAIKGTAVVFREVVGRHADGRGVIDCRNINCHSVRRFIIVNAIAD